MGEDPKGFDAGDYNLFRYCHNDPDDLTDPMGMDPVTISDELDRASRAGLATVREISRTNSDGKGIGVFQWERSKSVGIGADNHPFLSKETGVGRGTEYKGPQKIEFPAPGDGAEPQTFLHNHTNNRTVDGKLSTPADRNAADQETTVRGVYTISKDKSIIERYRPSDNETERSQHKGGVTERWDGKKWAPVQNGAGAASQSQQFLYFSSITPVRQSANIEPQDLPGGSGLISDALAGVGAGGGLGATRGPP